jgi:multiple sugar transport system permease protein
MTDLNVRPRLVARPGRGGARPRGSHRESARTAQIVLTVAALLMIFPFGWQVITSVKTLTESLRVPPSLIPHTLDLANYVEVFQQLPFLRMFLVTTGYALVLVFGHVFLGSMAAYAFAFLEFPARNLVFVVLLSVLMVPRQLYLIPQYEIVQGLGWSDSFLGMTVPHLMGVFMVFLMRQFFLGLPRELIEAAQIDGAGHLRTYFSIMLPVARPGLIAATILTVLYSWNDLLWPLIVIDSPNRMPLTAGLATLQGEFFTDRPVIMAGATLAALPMIVVFVLLQRQFIQGVAFTGSK